MTRRRSSGLLATMAEVQRQRQRQAQEIQRAQWRAQVEAENEQRRAWHAAALQDRIAWESYQVAQQEQAERATAAIERDLAALDDVLTVALRRGPIRPEGLKLPLQLPSMNPGALAYPVVMPDPARYQLPPSPPLVTPKARRKRQAAEMAARAAYERDYQAAVAADQQRKARLAEYQGSYLAWEGQQRAQIASQHAQVDQLAARFAAGDPDAGAEIAAAVLYSSSPWPPGFSLMFQTAWDDVESQLVISWQLPPVSVIPQLESLRYVKATDRWVERPRTPADIRKRYRQLIARSALRIAAELIMFDTGRVFRSFALSGYITGLDPATGLPRRVWLFSGIFDRAELEQARIQLVEPVACVTAARALLSSRPDEDTPITPLRIPESLSSTGAAVTNSDVLGALLEMDPIDFEELVARLFQSLGFQVATTARTGDGGIDVEAVNPDPITGGRVVVQVKRYKSTVNPSAVRDLYGTVAHTGATKGILVTTSGFGPDSRAFAADKPLTLLGGEQLVSLLREHGLATSE
jgi:restriction system protein